MPRSCRRPATWARWGSACPARLASWLAIAEQATACSQKGALGRTSEPREAKTLARDRDIRVWEISEKPTRMTALVTSVTFPGWP